MVRVEITDAARVQLGKLPVVIARRVTQLIERLEQWPAVSGAKPLRGNRVGQYRLRTGDFRLIFKVVANVAYVLEIGNRKDIYEE